MAYAGHVRWPAVRHNRCCFSTESGTSLPTAWQRCSLAGEALRRLQRQAARAGRDLSLAVRAENAGARRLYAALGFAVEREDAAVLQLRWRSGPG